MWRVTGVRQKKYADSLKLLCRKGATARLPPSPSCCPRCARKTNFWAQVCFMENVAGAYVFIVSATSSCRMGSQYTSRRGITRGRAAIIVIGQSNLALRNHSWKKSKLSGHDFARLHRERATGKLR